MTLSFSRLACLAVFAVIALVACGEGPGGSVASTSPPKVIPHVSALAIGKSLEIPLADKFSAPGALTYEATSSDPAVATATVDGKTLTITAKGAGNAEITVTAADSQDRTASQTFKVTVEPTTSEPEPGAPTVKDGAPTSVDFEAGESTTKTVTLSQVFEGDDLTYSAPESDDTDVAIASISNRVLIIRAGDPGEATITVTATNAKGEVEHEIAVTVAAPDDDDGGDDGNGTSSSATLKIDLGESVEYSLSSGQTLQPVGDGVKVERILIGETGNKWLIIAKKKGSHKVSILSEGKLVRTITVEVPNSRPVRNDTKETTNDPPEEKDLNNLRIVLTSDNAPKSPDAGVLVTGSAGADDNARISPVHLVDYFTDDDKDDPIYYRIEDQPLWLLIDTENGFVKDLSGTAAGFHLGYEVLQEVVQKRVSAPEFTVTLYASDGEMESTRPVFIEFDLDDSMTVLPPRPLTGETGYRIDQRGTTGDFYNATIDVDSAPKNRLDVGPRRGVPHTVTFNGVAGSITGSGFVFAEEKAKALGLTAALNLVGVYYKDEGGSPTRVGGGEPIVPPKEKQPPGTHYFLIRSTGTVVVKGATAAGADQTVTFELEKGSSGRLGNIIIEHHVWLDSEEATTSSKAPLASKTLRIDVVPCNSPPNPIADCP